MVEKLTSGLNRDQLFKFFSAKLRNVFRNIKDDKRLKGGMTCGLSALLIVEDLGGPTQARIWWLDEDSHYYVIKFDQNRDEFAFNNTGKQKRTVGYVKDNGFDDTDGVLKTPLNQLFST